MGGDVEVGHGKSATPAISENPPATKPRGCMPACSRALNFITAACTLLCIVAFGLAIALGPHKRVCLAVGRPLLLLLLLLLLPAGFDCLLDLWSLK